MLKSWFLVLPFYLLTLLPLHAQPEVSLLKPGTNAEGQVYYLPKTAIRFYVQVEKTTYIPGEYARYAERYLKLTGIQQEKQVTYQLINYDMSTIGVRDTSKCYLLQMKGKAEQRWYPPGSKQFAYPPIDRFTICYSPLTDSSLTLSPFTHPFRRSHGGR